MAQVYCQAGRSGPNRRRTNALGEPVELDYVSAAFALANDSAWVASELRPELYRVDLTTREIEVIGLPFASADGIAADEQRVWAYSGPAGEIVRLVSASGAVESHYRSI